MINKIVREIGSELLLQPLPKAISILAFIFMSGVLTGIVATLWIIN